MPEKAILSPWQIRQLALPIVARLSEIEKFYENPENEAGFQKWLAERNGE